MQSDIPLTVQHRSQPCKSFGDTLIYSFEIREYLFCWRILDALVHGLGVLVEAEVVVVVDDLLFSNQEALVRT